jgi:hypothetical protein
MHFPRRNRTRGQHAQHYHNRLPRVGCGAKALMGRTESKQIAGCGTGGMGLLMSTTRPASSSEKYTCVRIRAYVYTASVAPSSIVKISELLMYDVYGASAMKYLNQMKWMVLSIRCTYDSLTAMSRHGRKMGLYGLYVSSFASSPVFSDVNVHIARLERSCTMRVSSWKKVVVETQIRPAPASVFD